MKLTSEQRAIEAKAASIQLMKQTQREGKEYQDAMFYMVQQDKPRLGMHCKGYDIEAEILINQMIEECSQDGIIGGD